MVACDSGGEATQQVAQVVVGISSSGQSELAPLGVPTDPTTNLPGVTEAVLTVFRDDVEVFFDADGNEVDPGSGVDLVLSSGVSQLLNLVHGTYDFVIVGQDTAGNPLADGLIEDLEVAGDVEVLVPMVSRLGSADFSAPVLVMPNQIFDVFLNVRPPTRTDLIVPTTDFDAVYDYGGGTEVGSSDLGIRMLAECEAVDISADIYGPSDTAPALTAATTVPVDFICPPVGGTIGVDLLPPFLDVDSHTDGEEIAADPVVSVNLFGSVNDSQTGIASVEVYEGVVLVGTAEVTPAVDPEPMGTWSLTDTFYVTEARTYNMTVVATDGAGNETRVQFQLVAVEN